jgi:DNA-binding response OmpR family regulator
MNTLKILLIDKNKKEAGSLSALLKEEGYRIQCANTGYEGIKKAKEGDFNLIITDLSFPDIRGEAFIYRLRQAAKNKIPIIALSEDDDSEAIEELFRRGVDEYIIKPARFSYLMRRIENLLSGSIPK